MCALAQYAPTPADAMATGVHGHGEAGRRPPATGMTSLAGQVRDGLALERSKAPRLLVPGGLPVVAGAAVTLSGHGLALRAVTGTRGTFSFGGVRLARAGSYTLTVREHGLGGWQETGIVLYPGLPAQIYVELHSYPQHLAVRPPARPSAGRATQAGALPAAAGCPPGSRASQLEQPGTIRVYLEGAGQVQNFDFTFYLQHVLPNEWVPTWDPAALQAGAVAVRDYAWSFVVNGSKGTASGYNPCAFDVDDTTAYQDFQPSGPTYASTDSAVYATAGFLYRDGHGDIPQTAYQAGLQSDACGQTAGASGTGVMSQWGSQACARAGDSFGQILGAYYGYPGPVPFGSRDEGAAVDSHGDRFAFWQNQAGGLEEAWYSASAQPAGWNGPQAIPAAGPLGSAPAVAVTSQYVNGNPLQYVFWQGAGASPGLWMAYFDGSAWHGPVDLGLGPLGSPPAAAADGAGKVYVFWRSPAGDLEEASSATPRRAASWSDPDVISGAGQAGSSPAAAADPAEGSVLVCWRTAAGGLGAERWDGSSWTRVAAPGVGALASPPAAGADSAGNIDVYFENAAGGLSRASLAAAASSWQVSAVTVGGDAIGPLGSAPAAAVEPDGDQFIFWTGTNGNLRQAYWNGRFGGPSLNAFGPLG
jgi:hypothetical protein